MPILKKAQKNNISTRRQNNSTSIGSTLGSTLGQGIAFGAGSSIGHSVIGGIGSIFTGAAEGKAPDHSSNQKKDCKILLSTFDECMKNNYNDKEACKSYYDLLEKCLTSGH